MLGQLVTRITITLIRIVVVVTLGVACSHPGLQDLPDNPGPVVPPFSDGDQDNNSEDEITPPDEGATIYGRVRTPDGTPVAGVPVSDGIDITLTDENGCYSLISDKTKGCVFVIVPGNYAPVFSDNMPRFSHRLTMPSFVLETQDFILTPTDHSRYTILVQADQHLANRLTSDLNQFKTQAIPDMNDFIAAEKGSGRKVYSISLGDIGWEQYWKANNFGLTDALHCFDELDCPIYHTIGNHDNNPYISDDWISSALFRDNIAPTYYSFNIGTVHFVVLDNIIYNNPGATSTEMGERSYDRALTDEQLQWLEKDLALIADKATPVVICAHVPFYSDPTLSKGLPVSKRNMLNMEQLEQVIAPFTNLTLLSAHYHRNYTVIPSFNPNIREHNVASVCGSLWWTAAPGYTDHHLCTDGTPGGYGILRIDGRETDYSYKGIGRPEQEQFRIYDLNCVKIDEEDVSGSAKYKAMVKDYAGDYYAPAKDNGILINVFNYQPEWQVEVFENGEALEVKRVRVKDPLHILAYECQRLSKNAVPTATSTFVTQNSSHFFRAKARHADSPITVRVTTGKGKTNQKTINRPLPFSLSDY